MVFFSTSERLEIGEVPFISHGVKPTRTEALEYYRRVKDSWDLKVNTYEKVVVIESREEHFKIETNKNIYQKISFPLSLRRLSPNDFLFRLA